MGAIGLDAIVKALERKTTLEEINLSDNFPEVFRYSHDEVREWPQTLAKVLEGSQNLRKLSLAEMHLELTSFIPIIQSLQNKKTLSVLNLVRNRLEDATVQNELIELLKTTPSIEKISLGQSSIATDTVTQIIQILPSHLKSLNIAELGLGDDEMVEISKELGRFHSLEKLNLSSNTFMCRGAAALANLLKTNRSIQKLFLDWMPSLGAEGIISIAEVLKDHNRTLEHITLNETFAGIDAVTAIANIFSENKTLKILDIGNNDLKTEELITLKNSLESNRPPIEGFMIPCNYPYVEFLPDGTERAIEPDEFLKASADLINILKKIPTIKNLGYSDRYQISSIEVDAIASLIQSAQLTSLDLCTSRIPPDGLIMIAKALKANKTLESLALDLNEVDDDSLTEIVKTLNHHPSLKWVCLQIENDGLRKAKIILEGLKDNRKIEKLIFRYFSAVDRDLESIRNLLNKTEMNQIKFTLYQVFMEVMESHEAED